MKTLIMMDFSRLNAFLVDEEGTKGRPYLVAFTDQESRKTISVNLSFDPAHTNWNELWLSSLRSLSPQPGQKPSKGSGK